jgi:uncharacterized membrane protein
MNKLTESNELTPFKAGLILIAITALGGFLRLYHLSYQSLWLDELHSVIPTDPLNPIPLLIEYCKHDQPPLFFLFLTSVFRIFETTDFAARLACSLLGIISIPVAYLLGKEFYNKKVGILTALLTCVNFYHIFYSQEVRFYSLTFLLAALSYLFFLRGFKRGKVIDYVGYIFFTASLLYTHYYGLLIFGVQSITFVLLVIIYKRDKKFIIGGILSGILVLVAFIPWIPVIIHDLGLTDFWMKKPPVYFMAKFIYEYFGKDALVSTVFFLCLLYFLKPFLRKVWLQQEGPIYIILASWVILSYLVPYVKSMISTPILATRYTMVTLPACMVLFAMGLSKIPKLKWQYSVIIIVVLSSLTNLFFIRKYYTSPNKTQFREVSQLVQSRNSQSGYPVLSSLTWFYGWYFKGQPNQVKDVNSSNFDSIDKFWLIQAHFPDTTRQREVRKFTDRFDIAEKYQFFQADAVLMVKKKEKASN